jgi:WD repeat-containing protein 76
MGIFDASQEREEDEQEPVVNHFKVHARTITSVLFAPNDMKSVYTSSYDSSIRKMDLEDFKTVQVWSPKEEDEEQAISAMDMPASDPNLLFFSTLGGGLGRYDMRDPKSEEIWSLSESKIGGFSLHPRLPHLVATASLDRTLKIWDLRKITGKGDVRHPVLMGEHDSRLSVSHASWSPAGDLATSSYDDTLKVYHFPDAGAWKPGQIVSQKEMEPKYSIKHNNQTGRWVTILKPQWQKNPRDGVHKFAVGNMNRFVDVFAANGQQLAQLGGEGITAVPAVAHFHPSMEWIAGGNGSGKLCLWMPPRGE